MKLQYYIAYYLYYLWSVLIKIKYEKSHKYSAIIINDAYLMIKTIGIWNCIKRLLKSPRELILKNRVNNGKYILWDEKWPRPS